MPFLWGGYGDTWEAWFGCTLVVGVAGIPIVRPGDVFLIKMKF